MGASPSTVITMGLGSFGSANLLPTLGYGIASVMQTFGRMEFTVPANRLNYVAPLNRFDYTVPRSEFEETAPNP